jgi:hypothetical protein
VQLESTRQFLGATARARYCAGGRTVDGLSVAVCEYDSAAKAAEGLHHVETHFPGVVGRRILGRGRFTLTLTTEQPVPSLALAEAAFQTLPTSESP